ncbi:MAG: transposase [Actinophytocola sp.]|nr:transposase [Actinophytocola sp.]
MGRQVRAMHVARIRGRYVDKNGRRREYESRYLRRTYRDGSKVRHETLANLSGLADDVVDAIEATLKGQVLVPAAEAVTITRSLPHGHVAAVAAMAHQLGFPALLGPACRQRDLALALILSRVVRPASKLSTLSWWSDVTLGTDLGVADASTDEIYAAMDWLADQQDHIEGRLARTHLSAEVNPSRMALFDLTSAWVEGSHCPLAGRGYSRDGKKGKAQIEYGFLTDPEGRPVAVRVFDGATGDPRAFTDIVQVISEKFGLTDLVLVGDRGMITKARVDALKELGDDGDTDASFGWITALRAPTITKLVRDGAVQLSLFDAQDLAEISHPDYPDERLIACRNPLLAAERARKRDDLLAATEKQLRVIADRVARGTLVGADKIGVEVGKVINHYKVGKHFTLAITDTSLTWQRDQAKIDAEAQLDGFYVLRTSITADTLDAAGVVFGYKNLAHVERDFRIVKVDDLDLRPIYHRLEERVRAHVLICMLACYLVWHLRRTWAPLTFTDEHPPDRDNPVAPARRSGHAERKAHYQYDTFGHPYRSFGNLLDHIATLTRNQVRFPGTDTEVSVLTEPTGDQRLAFDLLNTPIPLTCT